jgi:hypothetical protein
VSSRISFVSKDQITTSTTAVIGQYVIERNVTLLQNDNVDIGHYDAVLPSEENYSLCIKVQ